MFDNVNNNKKSESILRSTSIWDYISAIPEKLLKTRVMYGFLDKPNRTEFKIKK